MVQMGLANDNFIPREMHILNHKGSENSSNKESYFSHFGASLVILSTFRFEYDWAGLTRKYGPICFLSKVMKVL